VKHPPPWLFVLPYIPAIVLAFVFWRLGSFGKWRHPAEPDVAA
jgi:hypothetical protein